MNKRDFWDKERSVRLTSAAEFGRRLLRERGVSRNVTYGWKGETVCLYVKGSESSFEGLPKKAPNGVPLHYEFY